MKNKLLFLLLVLAGFKLEAQAPDYDWVKQMGSTTGDLFITSAVTDAHGNLYTTGVFDGTVNFNPPALTDTLTDSGFGDVFISKRDSAGNFLWVKQIGGSSYDEGNSIAVDASGNIYVTGFFSVDSTDFDPGAGIHYLSDPFFSATTFLLKLDADGNFIWASAFSGQGSNSPSSLALDDSDNIVMTGIFDNTIDFDPGIAIFNMTALSENMYILKLDSAGSFKWAEQVDAQLTSTRSYSVATDAAGNIYLTGLLLGTVDIDPGAGVFNITATSIFGGPFILKLDASGNFVWAKVINGSIDESRSDHAIRVDDAGNSYTTGWFNNTVDFDPDSGIYNLTNTISTGGSTYLLKLDSAGKLVWVNQIGDPNDGNQRALALDAAQHIYIAGTLNTGGDFDPGTGTDSLFFANGKTFVASYHSDGSFRWAVQFSGNQICSDNSVTINVDPFGNVISTGTFTGTGDFDPGAATVNLTANSSIAVFLHKMTPAVISGMQNPENNTSAINIFPNPNSGTFYLNTSNAGTYRIVNSFGVIVKTVFVGEKNQEVSDLEDGLYFIQNTEQHKSDCRKVLVVK